MKNTLNYNYMIKELRRFFQEKKGFIEVPSQARTSILAACEQPKTITDYSIGGKTFPLPQTGQMWLEYEMLKNPSWPGVFCITTSYRDEKNPIQGRHERVFPMFEFESLGGFEELKKLEKELLAHLGFEEPISIDYCQIAKNYETEILEAEHELSLAKQFGASISLENFPGYTNPFWNMKQGSNGLYNKIDVLLHGMETIGSAERETDKNLMRERFFTIENGEYSNLLFSRYGQDRVIAELDEYLSLDMVKRFGAGIGVTRLERAMELSNLLPSSTEFINFRPAIPQVSL